MTCYEKHLIWSALGSDLVWSGLLWSAFGMKYNGMKWLRYGVTQGKKWPIVWSDSEYEVTPNMKWLQIWSDSKYEVTPGMRWTWDVVNTFFPFGMKWLQKWSEHGMKWLGTIVLDCSTIKIWDTAFRYQFKTYEFIVGCYLLAIITTMLLTLI